MTFEELLSQSMRDVINESLACGGITETTCKGYRCHADMWGRATVTIELDSAMPIEYRYESIQDIENLPKFKSWSEVSKSDIDEINEEYTKYKLKDFLNEG